MSAEECSKLLKNLKSRSRVECSTDGKKFFIFINLDGLKSDDAFEILDEVRSKVPKQLGGKPVRVYTTGVFDLV